MDCPHAFRWIDHIQHLPGMLEQVHALGIFVSFPKKESEQELSKAQLKKLAKLQYQKAEKEKKKGGEPQKGAPKEEAKKEQATE